MSPQLILIPDTGLELGGIKLSTAALVVPADASDADLESIGRWIKFTARGSQWVQGDYVNAVAARREGLVDIAHVANVWGVTDRSLRDAVECAKYYPAESRLEALSFNHHFEAKALGDLETSLELLATAVEKNLTCIALRALVREKLDAKKGGMLGGIDTDAESDSDAGPVRDLWVSDLCALDRAAKAKLAEGWVPDAEVAEGLLKKTRYLRELLEAIEEVAGIKV